MSDLGRRLLIGLAAGTAGVMAVGYAFIFGGIATPIQGERAVLDVPAIGTATASTLDDGRPVFVVNDPETGIAVLDARARRPASRLGIAVAWCAETRLFVDRVDGSAYAADGTLRWGPGDGGMVAFEARPSPDDGSLLIVGPDTSAPDRGRQAGGPPQTTCPGDAWVVHEPQPDEIFDPSLAVDQEPPGWIWLEGTLRALEGEARLCDARSFGCDGSATALGIDPATVSGAIEGSFIGRVRDGAVEGLILVPQPQEGS